MQFFECEHIVTCIFIIDTVYVLFDYIPPKKKLVYRRFLEYVANACGSWFLMKGAPLTTWGHKV